MIRAAKLMKELTVNHTQPLSGKYVEVILKVATLEERIRAFVAIGLIGRSSKLKRQLTKLIKQIKIDFKNEQLGNDEKDD